MVHSVEIKRAYQCDYCNKQYVVYKSAWTHEQRYCKDRASPHVKKCEHRFETYWDIETAGGVAEPLFEYCVKCGIHDD